AFVAVVPSRFDIAAFSPELAAVVDELRRVDLPAFPRLGLGDPRFGAPDGLRALFTPDRGFASVAIEPEALVVDATAEELREEIACLYWFDMLTEASRARLMGECARLLPPRVTARLQLIVLTARRSA
ncbi:MAG TPA: hypothetical protein VE987_01140, partial [Polyangiaceae bacterium]|nr:hypothetical protein [Polyangiaceae bacterium]